MKQGREKNDFGALLADGQLPSSKGTLYTVLEGFRLLIEFFRVYNDNSVAEDVRIYVKPGATSRTIDRHMSLAASTAADVISNGQILTLMPGDLIEGQTTTAAKVDYVISGRLEPV